jgi:hypothetical protein
LDSLWGRFSRRSDSLPRKTPWQRHFLLAIYFYWIKSAVPADVAQHRRFSGSMTTSSSICTHSKWRAADC